MTLTIIQCCNDQIHSWSTSQDVAGCNGAVVGGGWCEPSQCEGACCCVLHGNTAPPTSHRDTRERVTSDHSIAQGRDRRGPRESYVPLFRGDCEALWWTSRSWGRKSENTCSKVYLGRWLANTGVEMNV